MAVMLGSMMVALALGSAVEPADGAVLRTDPGVASTYSFSEVPILRLERHRRTAIEIEDRAAQLIDRFKDFDIELDEDTIEAWAEAAVKEPERFHWTRPVIDHPHIVVGYQRAHDDLIIHDTFLWELERGVGPAGPETDIGEASAFQVLEQVLEEFRMREVVLCDVHPSYASVAYVKEWVQVVGETPFSWTSE